MFKNVKVKAKMLVKFRVQRMCRFPLKCTKKRLAAGLRPNPLVQLKRSPRPPSRNNGKGRRRKRRENGKKGIGTAGEGNRGEDKRTPKGKEGGKGKGRKGGKGEKRGEETNMH